MQDNSRIKLNIEGRIFETTYKVIKRSKFFEDYFIQFSENREIMVNQSADAFEHILRYMEDPFYEVPENFKQDMRYYCIKGDSNDYEENKELFFLKKQKILDDEKKIELMKKNIISTREKLIDLYIYEFKKKHECIYFIATYTPESFYRRSEPWEDLTNHITNSKDYISAVSQLGTVPHHGGYCLIDIIDINDSKTIKSLYIQSFHLTIESANDVLTDKQKHIDINLDVNFFTDSNAYFPNDFVRYRVKNINLVENMDKFLEFLYNNDLNYLFNYESMIV